MFVHCNIISIKCVPSSEYISVRCLSSVQVMLIYISEVSLTGAVIQPQCTLSIEMTSLLSLYNVELRRLFIVI